LIVAADKDPTRPRANQNSEKAGKSGLLFWFGGCFHFEGAVNQRVDLWQHSQAGRSTADTNPAPNAHLRECINPCQRNRICSAGQVKSKDWGTIPATLITTSSQKDFDKSRQLVPIGIIMTPSYLCRVSLVAFIAVASLVSVSLGQTVWTGNADGTTWTNVGNWSNGLPSPTSQAQFLNGSIPDAPIAIDVNAPQTVGGFNFRNSSLRTITFSGSTLSILADGPTTWNTTSPGSAAIIINSNVDLSSVTANTSATWTINTSQAITLNGNFTTSGTGARPMQITGTASQVVTINGSNAASTFSFGGTGEVIAGSTSALGAGGVQKTNTATLSLRSDLTVAGTWLQSTGSPYTYLRISEVSASSLNRTFTINDRIAGSTGAIEWVGNINSTGKLILELKYNGGTAQELPLITNASAIVRFAQAPSATRLYSGLISGAGSVELTAGGSTTLSAANSYTGDTTVTSGTLTAGIANALGSNSSILLATGGTLNLNNFNQTVGSLGDVSVGSIGTITLGNATLTTGGGNKSASFNGVIQGAGNLIKTGTGTQTLTGVNTYTGTTTVSAGTLLVGDSGSINSTTGAIAINANNAKLRYNSTVGLSRNVTVTNSGTFAYNSINNYSGSLTLTSGKLGGTNWNGTLNNLTIGANQTISPGNSPGTANTGSQTWASLGSYDWEINKANGTAGGDPGWDLLNLSGALTITATSGSKFTINVISLGLDNNPGDADSFVNTNTYYWLIAQAGSAITTFSEDLFAININAFTNTLDPSGSFSIKRGDAVSGGNNTQLYLVYSAAAIPEPSTAALLLLGGLYFVARNRKTRKALRATFSR